MLRERDIRQSMQQSAQRLEEGDSQINPMINCEEQEVELKFEPGEIEIVDKDAIDRNGKSGFLSKEEAKDLFTIS